MKTPFHQTLGPLLLAPMGAMVVVSVALVCYGAEIVFVFPVLLFWPRLRQPPFWLGALWGSS